MDTLSGPVIVISLILSAFFSGMEIAFITSNKLKIELDKKLGILPARIYSYFLKNQGAFISTMLIGNNIALVVYGIYMALILEPYFFSLFPNQFAVFLAQTIVSTLLVLITAEFLPKVVFRINPNRTLQLFALPTAIIYVILYPVVYLTMFISSFILRTFLGTKIVPEEVSFGRIDLDYYLREATREVKNNEEIENEVQILQNALDFSAVKLRECMIPRTEIIALSENAEVETLKKAFIENGLSRVLIYRDDIDNIIGYTHSFELFKNPVSIKSILLPITILPEAMQAHKALSHLIKNKKNIAVVVDEFGGTAGVVTTEDIIEEIVGDIEDEHDVDLLTNEKTSENEYLLSARLDIDFINEEHQLELPESEEFETLGGFITHFHESIPEKGEVISIEDFEFHIVEVSDNKIETVRLKVLS
ncbi:MAG: HlyC/CorC family transporter [Flavobacteriales bacterium]|nr:HlyC/CorC family transporter [Flavobacteriales bacterium]